jgi:hypothetical protein
MCRANCRIPYAIAMFDKHPSDNIGPSGGFLSSDVQGFFQQSPCANEWQGRGDNVDERPPIESSPTSGHFVPCDSSGRPHHGLSLTLLLCRNEVYPLRVCCLRCQQAPYELYSDLMVLGILFRSHSRVPFHSPSPWWLSDMLDLGAPVGSKDDDLTFSYFKFVDSYLRYCQTQWLLSTRCITCPF